MRVIQLLIPLLAALAATACARQQQASYVIDPSTGQPVPVAHQYAPAQSGQYAYAQAGYRGGYQAGYRSGYPATYAQAAPSYAQPPLEAQYAQSTNRGLFNSHDTYQQSGGRGLLGARPSYAPPQYAQPQYPYRSYVLQYHPPAAANAYQAAPYGYSYAYAPSNYDQGYTLDSGDKLRVVVFGQQGISGSYIVDAGGNVSLPLAGTIPARHFTTRQLAKEITDRLKQGYVRDPHVTVTIESYRPFFILGEVTTPGQYPYVPNMTVENAIAVAGGFAPRAQKQTVELTRNGNGQRFTGDVPLNYPMRPGDTVVVKERWF